MKKLIAYLFAIATLSACGVTLDHIVPTDTHGEWASKINENTDLTETNVLNIVSGDVVVSNAFVTADGVVSASYAAADTTLQDQIDVISTGQAPDYTAVSNLAYSAIQPTNANLNGNALWGMADPTNGNQVGDWDWMKTEFVEHADTNAVIAEAVGQLVFNVKNYGAVGDGTTRDNVGINLAIDTAITAGGGVVYLPPGEYLVNQSSISEIPTWPGGYTVPSIYLGGNIHLKGAGKGVTIIKRDPAAGTASFSSVLAIGSDYITVSDLTIMGTNSGSYLSTESEGLNFKNDCHSILVDSVEFINIQNEAIDIDVVDRVAMESLGVTQYRVLNCDFYNIGGNGVHNANWSAVSGCNFDNVAKLRYAGFLVSAAGTSGQGAIDGAGHRGFINNCTFNDCVRAFHGYSALVAITNHSMIISDCVITEGLVAEPGDPALGQIVIAGGVSGDVVVTGVSILGGSPSIVGPRHISGCSLVADGSVIDPPGMVVKGTLADSTIIGFGVLIQASPYPIIISGCTINKQGNSIQQEAIRFHVSGMTNALIQGNTVTQDSVVSGGCIGNVSASFNVSDVRIIGNRCIEGTHGIRVSDNCIIQGNYVFGQQYGGITILGDDNIVTGNRSELLIADSGTGNIVTNNIAP